MELKIAQKNGECEHDSQDRQNYFCNEMDKKNIKDKIIKFS